MWRDVVISFFYILILTSKMTRRVTDVHDSEEDNDLTTKISTTQKKMMAVTKKNTSSTQTK